MLIHILNFFIIIYIINIEYIYEKKTLSRIDCVIIKLLVKKCPRG